MAARKRGIAPEFFTDDKIVGLSPLARLLFIGLWTQACDNGHVADRPVQLKVRLLPIDDVAIDDLLGELVTARLVERGAGFISVPKFAEHQRPHMSWWKTCEKDGCELPEGAGSSPSARRKARAEAASQRLHTSGATVDHGESTDEVDMDTEREHESESEVSTPLDADAPETRPEVEELLTQLADAVAGNGFKRPKANKAAADDMRRLLDIDGYTIEQVQWVIGYTARHSFWYKNIRSAPALRKNFERIKADALEESGKGGPKGQQASKPQWDEIAVPPDDGTPEELAAWHRANEERKRARMAGQA